MATTKKFHYEYKHATTDLEQATKFFYQVEVIDDRWVLAVLVSSQSGEACANFVFSQYPVNIKNNINKKVHSKGVHYQNILEHELKSVVLEWDRQCCFGSLHPAKKFWSATTDRSEFFSRLNYEKYKASGYSSGASVGSSLFDLHTGKVVVCTLGDVTGCICGPTGTPFYVTDSHSVVHGHMASNQANHEEFVVEKFGAVPVDPISGLCGQCTTWAAVGYNTPELAGVLSREPAAHTMLLPNKTDNVSVGLFSGTACRLQSPLVFGPALNYMPLGELVKTLNASKDGPDKSSCAVVVNVTRMRT
jgi:hypothetical protein